MKNIGPRTHCFWCRNDLRRFTKNREHTCYDVVEVLEQRISDLENTNKLLRREIENGRLAAEF